MSRSMRPSGENRRRGTCPTRLDAARAGSESWNRSNGKRSNAIRTVGQIPRRARDIDAGPGKGRSSAGGGAFTAFPLVGGRRMARGLLRTVTQHFRYGARSGRCRQRGYQQQQAGERRAKKAESPTNRSMLLPCCRQTPCLSKSPPRLNILSLGQYVGAMSTVHPEAGKFCEITPICRNQQTISLSRGTRNRMSRAPWLDAPRLWAHASRANRMKQTCSSKGRARSARCLAYLDPPVDRSRASSEFRVPVSARSFRHGASSLSNGDTR